MAARFDSRAVTVMVAQGASPETRSKVLATAARDGVAELIRSGVASPKFTRFVDGVQGATEDAVRPDGSIAYRFSYLGEVIAFAVAFLQARSPVRSGEYRRSFMVAIDGRPVPAAQVAPDRVPDDATIFIYNVQPYSRKIDVQIAGGRRLRVSVPAGIFDDAASAVQRRFGNGVTARRLYTLKFPSQARTKRGRAIEYPALEIGMR